MARAGEDALLDDPGIRADFQHVEIVIGFEDEAIGLAEVDLDEFGHVAEIGADGDLMAIGAEGKADGIGGIVRDGKSVNVNIADGEALAGLDGFDAAKTLAERIRENALELIHCWFGDVERSFPEAENLGKTVAMVGVLVSDEDGVEAVDVAFDGSEASEGFALAKPGVNDDASAFRLD